MNQPLRRILGVDVLGDGNESTMLLRYERLPKHCFRCGLIGHVVRDCLTKSSFDGPEDFNLLFGPWLNASSPVKSGQFRSAGDNRKNGGGTRTYGVSLLVILIHEILQCLNRPVMVVR